MYKNEQYNLVVDPLLSDNEYWQVNGFPIAAPGAATLAVTDILDYTITHYLLNNIDLNVLIGSALVVKVKDVKEGIKVELLGSGVKYKRIKKDKDCYLFFIDKSPGSYLRIRITNIGNSFIIINRVDANQGMTPFNFGLPSNWEKNKYGKIHIKDTASDALLIEGGADILGDSLFRGNLFIDKDLTIRGSVHVLGPVSEFHTETVKSKDNNIDLNVDGTDITANNAGITVLNSGNAFDPSIIWDNQFGAWKMKGGFLGGIPLGAVVDVSGSWDGSNNTGTFIEADTSVSGEIDKNGLMLADGVICPPDADPMFAGRYIPNLCDDRFLMGSTAAGAISVSDGVNDGNNNVQLNVGNLPTFTPSGSIDSINGTISPSGDLALHWANGINIREQIGGSIGGVYSIRTQLSVSQLGGTPQNDEILLYVPSHTHGISLSGGSLSMNQIGGNQSFDIRPKWSKIKRKMRVK